MSGEHDWAFGNCTRCGVSSSLVRTGHASARCGAPEHYVIGVDPAPGTDATVVASAADFHDKPKRLPQFQFFEWRSEAMRRLAESISSQSVFTRKFMSAAEPGRSAGLSRALRERAERAVGRVTAVNFTRAAPDEAIVTHLCEIAERLGGSDVAQLDQENARLRRELAEAKAARDGWQGQARTLMSLTYGLRKRLGEREDNVTYVEPFPDVQPYDGDWIPPAHRPRMAP